MKEIKISGLKAAWEKDQEVRRILKQAGMKLPLTPLDLYPVEFSDEETVLDFSLFEAYFNTSRQLYKLRDAIGEIDTTAEGFAFVAGELHSKIGDAIYDQDYDSLVKISNMVKDEEKTAEYCWVADFCPEEKRELAMCFVKDDDWLRKNWPFYNIAFDGDNTRVIDRAWLIIKDSKYDIYHHGWFIEDYLYTRVANEKIRQAMHPSKCSVKYPLLDAYCHNVSDWCEKKILELCGDECLQECREAIAACADFTEIQRITKKYWEN